MKKFFLLILPLVGFSTAWADISIQNDQQYYGDDGALHIVGEIQNNLNIPLNQIEIQANLFSQGVEIDSVKTAPMLNTIMPEMKVPFDFVILGDKIKLINDYSLEINYKVTEPKNQVIDITTSDFSRDALDNLVISGKVTNLGENTANTIVVVATLYDREGKVASVSKTHLEPDYLRANGETFFIISVPDKAQSNSIVDYSLVAESEEYTAVPEFPIGSMILLASSVSAYLILTRYSKGLITNLVSATNPK